jgi:magnesium transporter
MLVDRLLFGNADISLLVALVVAITIFATVVSAKLIGAILPLIAEKLGFDPTVMASPFITTIIDALSLIVYFAVASSLLNI